MKKETPAHWPKDFETDLQIVPPGEFTTFKEYPRSTQPARVRKLPVLRGYFDGKRFDMAPGLPSHIGWGSVATGNAVALTFRIQRGPNVLYWLANASDPAVWTVLDTWAAAKTTVLAAEFQDAPAFLACRDFDLNHLRFSGLRNAVRDAGHTRDFLADVTRALATNELANMASTDIPTYPHLQHVQGCMVRTRHTGGVALVVNDTMPEQGPIADAIATVSKALLQPSKTFH